MHDGLQIAVFPSKNSNNLQGDDAKDRLDVYKSENGVPHAHTSRSASAVKYPSRSKVISFGDVSMVNS